MEFLLHWWDELDDVAALCRHLSRGVITELASLRVPLRTWGGAYGGRSTRGSGLAATAGPIRRALIR